MVNRSTSIKKSYLLFFICLYPVVSSLIWNYKYYLQLIRELKSPPADLNVELAQRIVDNFSYTDLVIGFTQDIEMYLSFLLILMGLFFGDIIFKQIRDNTYYILRNRLSYRSYMILIYKSVLKRMLVIEGILMAFVFIFALLLAGINPQLIFLFESLVPFVFMFLYSSLLVLLTINLNAIISNLYILKLLPFILMYVPILGSTFLYKIIPNAESFINFSYLTFVPRFSYSTTEVHVNFINWISGSLTNGEVSFLTQMIQPFVVPYLILILLVIFTFNVGKKSEWYA